MSHPGPRPTTSCLQRRLPGTQWALYLPRVPEALLLCLLRPCWRVRVCGALPGQCVISSRGVIYLNAPVWEGLLTNLHVFTRV